MSSASIIDRAGMVEQQHQEGGQSVMKHRFSPDELRALRECNRESFYYRCLPFGTSLSLATYFAVKNGYLKASPRFGAGPKMFAAAIVGYFVGKFSYQSACLDKLMALPNSELAEQLRKRKGLPSRGDWGGVGGVGEGLSFPSFMPSSGASEPSSGGSEYSQNSTADSESNFRTDVGDTRPLDSFDVRSSSQRDRDVVMEEDIPIQPATKMTSYDELRRTNRDEFYKARSGPSPAPAAPPPRQQFREERPSFGSGSGGSGNKVKNQYGDVWEKTD